METIELGDTGEQVSQLALGAMLMGTSTDELTAFRMLDHYLAAGGSLVDTADCYAWWVAPGQRGWGERGAARAVATCARRAGPGLPGHEGQRRRIRDLDVGADGTRR